METSLDRIASGGSVFKLLVGEYCAGKTFFMNVVRGSAMERHTQSTSKDVPNTEKWDWVLPDELFLAGYTSRALDLEAVHALCIKLYEI